MCYHPVVQVYQRDVLTRLCEGRVEGVNDIEWLRVMRFYQEGEVSTQAHTHTHTHKLNAHYAGWPLYTHVCSQQHPVSSIQYVIPT